MIPFSAETFFSFLAQYNAAIWPLQILAYLLAGAAVFCALKPSQHSGRVIAAVLTAFWLGTGAVYHLQFFAKINFWDQAFGPLFLLQGLAFAWRALLRNRLEVLSESRPDRGLGLAILLFALVLYPLLSIIAGQGFSEIAWVGTSPTGTLLFTLGILCFCRPQRQKRLLILPVLCALAGTLFAYLLPLPQDWVLLPAALAVVYLALQRREKAA